MIGRILEYSNSRIHDMVYNFNKRMHLTILFILADIRQLLYIK